MANKTVKLDFTKILDMTQVHLELKNALGFIDGYGANINALIDCLSSMRYPEEGMSEVSLGLEEFLTIEAKSFSKANELVWDNLVIAIEEVNGREKARGRSPSIHLVLTT